MLCQQLKRCVGNCTSCRTSSLVKNYLIGNKCKLLESIMNEVGRISRLWQWMDDFEAVVKDKPFKL